LLLFSSDSLHPAIVHFPIALLAIAPLFCLGVLVLRDKGWWLSIATLVLLAIGTAGTHLASATGDAGEDKAEAVPGADIVVEEHERLAETATVFFTIVSPSHADLILRDYQTDSGSGSSSCSRTSTASPLASTPGTWQFNPPARPSPTSNPMPVTASNQK